MGGIISAISGIVSIIKMVVPAIKSIVNAIKGMIRWKKVKDINKIGKDSPSNEIDKLL